MSIIQKVLSWFKLTPPEEIVYQYPIVDSSVEVAIIVKQVTELSVKTGIPLDRIVVSGDAAGCLHKLIDSLKVLGPRLITVAVDQSDFELVKQLYPDVKPEGLRTVLGYSIRATDSDLSIAGMKGFNPENTYEIIEGLKVISLKSYTRIIVNQMEDLYTNFLARAYLFKLFPWAVSEEAKRHIRREIPFYPNFK